MPIMAIMKFHLIFIVVIIAIMWFALLFGYLDLFWTRVLGVLVGFFGFLFVFMLTDEIADGIRSFGVDLIVIAIALFVIWI
jgi:hypothetical protein